MHVWLLCNNCLTVRYNTAQINEHGEEDGVWLLVNNRRGKSLGLLFELVYPNAFISSRKGDSVKGR